MYWLIIIIKKELSNFNISDRKCLSKREAHRPKNSGTIIKLILVHIFFYVFLKKNPKLVREMWLWYIIRLELQKPKSAAWEKIYNKSRQYTIGIDYSDNNKCGSGFFFFILDSIQFQIYFMSIQIYFNFAHPTIPYCIREAIFIVHVLLIA